jgi:hypothetical protein
LAVIPAAQCITSRRGGRTEITVYVENSGEFIVNSDAIRAAHDGEVILDREGLAKSLLEAIDHAHDAEVPDFQDSVLGIARAHPGELTLFFEPVENMT